LNCERIEDTFLRLDEDGSGTLTVGEFCEGMWNELTSVVDRSDPLLAQTMRKDFYAIKNRMEDFYSQQEMLARLDHLKVALSEIPLLAQEIRGGVEKMSQVSKQQSQAGGLLLKDKGPRSQMPEWATGMAMDLKRALADSARLMNEVRRRTRDDPRFHQDNNTYMPCGEQAKLQTNSMQASCTPNSTSERKPNMSMKGTTAPVCCAKPSIGGIFSRVSSRGRSRLSRDDLTAVVASPKGEASRLLDPPLTGSECGSPRIAPPCRASSFKGVGHMLKQNAII